jgi:Na+/phosphate symporter
MHPTGTYLAPLLFLIGIIIVLASPRKLKTLGRMFLAFIVTAVPLLILGALLRKGEPEMLGILIGQMAIGVADALGLFYVLSLRRAKRDGASG